MDDNRIKELKDLIINSFFEITKLRNKKTCQYQVNVNLDTKQGYVFDIKNIKEEI